MKKFICMLFLIFLISTTLFTQDRKHTVYVDFYPMFTGYFSNQACLGIGFDYNINKS